jgi:hypothetical protein
MHDDVDMTEPQETLPELARLGLEPNAYERLVIQRMTELEADLETEDVRAHERRKAKLTRKGRSPSWTPVLSI